MKNITFSAEESLIQQARLKAMTEKTTLNEKFREWLSSYASTGSDKPSLHEIMDRLSYADAGRSFTRDDMNEH
jgi:hypothetical protein